MNYFVICWLLPSLVTFLALAILCRKDGNPLETFSVWEWIGIVLASILYPFGLYVVLSNERLLVPLKWLGAQLTKERGK